MFWRRWWHSDFLVTNAYTIWVFCILKRTPNCYPSEKYFSMASLCLVVVPIYLAKAFKEGWGYFGSQFEVIQSILAGKLWQQLGSLRGLVPLYLPTGKAESSELWHLICFLWITYRIPTHGMVLSYRGYPFPLHLTQVDCPLQTHLLVYFHGDSNPIKLTITYCNKDFFFLKKESDVVYPELELAIYTGLLSILPEYW